MDAEDVQDTFSDLGLSSITESPPTEEPADGSNTACSIDAESSVALVADPADNNQVATTINHITPRVATAIRSPGVGEPTGSSQFGGV